MELFTVGQSNTVGLDLLTADGTPIETGDVTFYLKAIAGEKAGKWWNAIAWSDTEKPATIDPAAIVHEGRGHWACTINAGAWLAGSRYKLYAVHEDDGQVNYRETAVEEWGSTLAAMPSDVADELISRLSEITQAMGAIPGPTYATVSKADILSFASRVWQKTGGFAWAALDDAIAATLSDLNGSDLLRRTETSGSLAAKDTTLAFPPYYKSVIAITLSDAAGKAYPPLGELPGDIRFVRHLTLNSTRPTHFIEDSECFRVYPTSDGSYDVTIDYWWNHPPTPDDLAYPIRFQHLLNVGTVYWEAMLRRNGEYIQHWQSVYFGARRAMENSSVPIFRGLGS